MRELLSIVIVFVCLFALGFSALYSIPYAFERVGDNPKPGARRMFAVYTVVGIAAPTAVLICFLVVGVAVLALPDNDLRATITRVSLMLGMFIVAAQVVLMPIAHRQIEDKANSEAAEVRGRRERSEEKLVEKIDKVQEVAEAVEEAHEKRHTEARSREKEHHEIQKRHESQEEGEGK